MSIFALLCLFSADYLTSHSRKIDIVLRMKQVKFSQILDHLLLLLIGFVLIQLRFQMVCYYLIFIAFISIKDILNTDHIIKLIDGNLSILQKNQQISDDITKMVDETKWPVASIKMFLNSS